MKILLTGRNGQVGFELQRALAILGHVKAISTSDCDLSDELALRRVIRAYCPDIIVNPAAYTAVDRAESEAKLAHAVNAHAPTVLAEEAQAIGAFLVHFSTDYVFDGSQSTPYTETDIPNPQGQYGLSKWLGEKGVASACTRHLIVRTSWVVGVHGGNFAKTMLRLASERDSLSVVADQWGAPTSAALIADVTAHLVRQAQHGPLEFPYGVYHLTASGKTNWHSYASYVIDRARNKGKAIRVTPDAIKAIATADYPTPAKRPTNSCLDTSKLRHTFKLHLPHWQAGVDHILDQIF